MKKYLIDDIEIFSNYKPEDRGFIATVVGSIILIAFGIFVFGYFSGLITF